MVLLLTRYLFLTSNTTEKEKMLKLPGSKAYYHSLVKQMSAEQVITTLSFYWSFLVQSYIPQLH